MNIVRVDTTSWIAGLVLAGNTGVGVLGSVIPSSGTNGASFLYNDIILPADADKSIRALILTRPSAGTLFVYEDGSFIFSGAPDGTYTFTYQLYVDGIITGSPATVTLTIGTGINASGSVVTTCTATLTTAIKLAAGASSTVTVTSSILTVIRLAANAFMVSTATATMTGGSPTTPFIRTVFFDGGTNRAVFDGGTNKVIFTF